MRRDYDLNVTIRMSPHCYARNHVKSEHLYNTGEDLLLLLEPPANSLLAVVLRMLLLSDPSALHKTNSLLNSLILPPLLLPISVAAFSSASDRYFM